MHQQSLNTMNYWVLKTDYSFVEVEGESIHNAIDEAEYGVKDGICVVSPYFKDFYGRYSELWDEVNELDTDGIDDVIYGQYYAINMLCVEDVMSSKNRLQLNEDTSIAVYNLSDHNFATIIQYLSAIRNLIQMGYADK